MLALFENPHHPEHNFHYSVCGNYIDIHVNYNCGEAPVPAGTCFEVNYVCELYGDEQTSIDELKAIGQRSIATGDITID